MNINNLINFNVFFEDGVYTADGGNFGIVTQGETLDILLKNIKEAVELYFEDEPVKSPYFTILYSDKVPN